MKLKEIYELVVKNAIKVDPRSEKGIKSSQEKLKKAFEKLEKKDKDRFDKERLINPYDDTRILYGNPDTEVKTIMAGIDVEVPGILLADRLNEKGKKIDLVVSHHPEGVALAALDKVMGVQADMIHKFGVSINVAEQLLAPRLSQVKRGIHGINHEAPVDAAKLLDIPFMCTHTVCDNLVYNFLQNLMDKKKPETVSEVLDVLRDIPEYKEADKLKAGPMVFAGCEDYRAGKIACVEITGGTSGAKELYEKMSNAGVGTIISMHMSEDYKKEAEKHNLNVVVAGHMSSDSLGMNLFMDELEKKNVSIVPMGGYIRFSRNKNK
jgi:putative NIF3 family GTP cyclohydrolase 1 type 2